MTSAFLTTTSGFVGDRHRLDQRRRTCLHAMHDDLVAGPDGKDQLSGHIRRQMDLRAVVENEAIDIVARSQDIGRDRTAKGRQLFWVERRILRETGGAEE